MPHRAKSIILCLCIGCWPAGLLAQSGAAAWQLKKAAAQQALRLLPDAASLRISWSATQPTPTQINGLKLRLPGKTDLLRAQALFSRYPALFADLSNDLEFLDAQEIRGRKMLRFQQRYQGLEVLDAQAVVTFDAALRIIAISSTVVPLELTQVTPALKPAQAVAAAAAQLSRPAPADLSASRARLVVLASGKPRLVYRVVLPLAVDPGARLHLVDAQSGATLGWRRGVLTDGPSYGKEVGR